MASTIVPAEIDAFLARVSPAVRQRDARTLLHLMMRVTGQPPVLAGTGIGFGHYRYRYASGHEGETTAAGFAPRKAAMSIYFVDGMGRHEAALAKLGPHTHGVGCLYVKDLAKVDLDVLEQMLISSYETLTSGTYPLRAREGRPQDAATARPLPAVGRPATAALHLAGYQTLESLAGTAAKDLLALHGVGPKAVGVIAAALAAERLSPLS